MTIPLTLLFSYVNTFTYPLSIINNTKILEDKKDSTSITVFITEYARKTKPWKKKILLTPEMQNATIEIPDAIDEVAIHANMDGSLAAPFLLSKMIIQKLQGITFEALVSQIYSYTRTQGAAEIHDPQVILKYKNGKILPYNLTLDFDKMKKGEKE